MTPWLQSPRLRIGADEPTARRVTWLELFYDLVFVVTVSQLAHQLSKTVSLAGVVEFVVLFVPVWWAWIGTTFYANRFDTDTGVRRGLMGVQMVAIAALAVNVHHGLAESSAGFALAYAIARFLLVLEYLWAGYCIPVARGLTTHYAVGFAIAAGLWLLSIFVPLPYRLGLWAAGLAIDFATPLTAQHHQARLLPDTEHLPERFGLFVIIVLGEAIIAVVNGIAEITWNWSSVLCAGLGFGTAFCLWWVYFENVDGSTLRLVKETGKIWVFQLWLYVHLPLVMGLTAMGVGVEHVIVAAQSGPLAGGDRWLLCGALACTYTALAVLHRTGVIFKCKARTKHRLAAAGVLLLVAIAGQPLLPLQVIGLVTLVGAIEVGLDLYQGKPQPLPQA